MMQISVKLVKIGNSTGFAIPEKATANLGLEVGDDVLIETEQFINGSQVTPMKVYLRGKVIKSGGKSGGFIIDRGMLTALHLEKGMVMNGTIKKE